MWEDNLRLDFILWWINNPNSAAWFNRFLPDSLDGFGPTVRAGQYLGLNFLDLYLLFSEVRLSAEGRDSESHSSLKAWLDSLGADWQANRMRWHNAIWDRLITRTPNVRASLVILDDGEPRTSIPLSVADFEHMFRNSAVQISFP